MNNAWRGKVVYSLASLLVVCLLVLAVVPSKKNGRDTPSKGSETDSNSSPGNEAVLGTWLLSEDSVPHSLVEFGKTGTLRVTRLETDYTAEEKYKFVEDNVISLTDPDSGEVQKVTLVVQPDKSLQVGYRGSLSKFHSNLRGKLERISDPTKLLGKWRLTSGQLKGTAIGLAKDGAITISGNGPVGRLGTGKFWLIADRWILMLVPDAQLRDEKVLVYRKFTITDVSEKAITLQDSGMQYSRKGLVPKEEFDCSGTFERIGN